MKKAFKNTVSAICYSIIKQRCQPLNELDLFFNNEVVKFVLHQYRVMPDYLRPPIFILTLIFDTWVLLRKRKFFWNLSAYERWQLIETWSHSPIGPYRDLIRFYESLTIFSWYSQASEYNLLKEKIYD